MSSLSLPGFGAGYTVPRRAVPHAPAGRRNPRLDIRKALTFLAYATLATLVAAGAGAALWCSQALRGLNHDLAALISYKPGEATLLYASDGSLLARVAKENRLYVPLERIPASMRDATVAAEDRRFWTHSGVDFRGLGRALYRDIREGRPAEGGSTLTMQLVRNIQLSPDKTLKRKIREAALSIQLERIYDKPRLLEMYLNQIFYGNGAYGIGAAARAYFGKSVNRLTPAQSALLATLPRRPTVFNPHRDPEGALSRRNRLLKEMAAQGYLTAAQLRKALKEPLGVRASTRLSTKAPYFVDAVVDRLVDLYGAKAVYQGGLRVYTTVNPVLQAEAESALERGVRSLRGRNVSQGALVSIDPYTAEVKAMVGGVDYARSPFNRALARRQPGSAFKPFVYATAFDAGLTPLDRITDSPVRLAGWSPRNHNGRYAGQVTLREAFAQSMNTPAVKLALKAGLPQVVNTALACGIRSPLRALPSLALGASEVTPLELTSAYGAFATMGLWAEPKLIRRVEDKNGNVLDRFDGFPATVLDGATAQKVDYLLRAVVEEGTGKTVRSIPRARGKTGTTQRDKDAWFVGYTPELVTGVWLGNDIPSRMHGIWGGTGCAPIWRTYMEQALRRVPRRTPMPTWTPPKKEVEPDAALIQTAQAVDPGENGLREAQAWGGQDEVTNSPADTSERNPDVRLLATFQRPGGRKVRLCTETNEAAGPYCPSTYTAVVAPEEDLPACAVHVQGWNRPVIESRTSGESYGEETIRYVGSGG